MDIASSAPLKRGVLRLFHDLQDSRRVEIAIISYGMKPFIERVLKSRGLSGIHVMANPIFDEVNGRLSLDLNRPGFDPYDLKMWPSEPMTQRVSRLIQGCPVTPATKGDVLKFLEQELEVDPVNTVVAGDSGGDVNMLRACKGLRIIQADDSVHLLRDPRLPAILKNTDIIAIQPDGGFGIAAQVVRDRMQI
jgi:hypothetical protein